MKKKRRQLSLRARIALCALFYAVILSFLGGLLLFNANYQHIYGSPEVKGGRIDFAGVELAQRKVACALSGEWEFFHDRWIVTDSDEGAPDGLLAIPGRWTGKDFGKGKLPAQGYASFRITVDGVEEGTPITVFRVNYAGAYRVFLNGTLVTESGTMSKDVWGTHVSGRLDMRRAFVADGGPLTIVIELSATRRGGLLAAPWFSESSSDSYGRSLRNFSSAALGVSSAAVLFVLLTTVFFRLKRDFSLSALMLSLFAHFLFSKDMLYFVPVPYGAALIVEAVSALLAVIAFLWHLHCAGMNASRTFHAVCAGGIAGMVVLFFVLGGTNFVTLPALGALLILCAYSYPLLSSRMHPAMRAIYAVLFAFLISIFAFELADGIGLILFGTEFIFSVEIMGMIACFAVLGLWRIAAAARQAQRAGELERELFRVKQTALKAQIKPHFVFNALTAIQALYRKDLAEGDEALAHFARHLRLNIDSDGEDMIPFEDEVRNILNYFELENLRAGGQLTLLLNINCTDFSVPVLSLQPLVENAILHGETAKRENGFIQLSSDREGGVITIRVTDNGKGFDPSACAAGVGLENTRKRFENMLNADMVVTSAPNEGTEIIITIKEDS